MANSWWDDIKELFKTKKQKAAEENEKVNNALRRESQITGPFGEAYAMTVMFCVTLAVQPRLSVTVRTTATVPLLATGPMVSAAPVVLETETPLQVAV